MSTFKALVAYPDGGVSIEHIDGLEGTQRTVGGYIEQVPGSGAGWIALANEEGKIKGLASNPTAERIFTSEGGTLPPGDWLVGPIVFLSADGAGSWRNVPEHMLEYATTSH